MRGQIEIIIDDSLFTLKDHPWMEITEWIEYHLGVKWYAIQAYCEDELVGFMHLIKHPGNAYEWYICDIHTLEQFRRQGVASTMIDEAKKILLRYDMAYRLTASVQRENIASVRLHEKMGFYNTEVVSSFPEMDFEEGETLYAYYFVSEFPARNIPLHRELIKTIAGAKAEEVWNLLEQSEANDTCQILLLWAGEQAVGCKIKNKTEQETILLSEWETYLQRKEQDR